MNKSKETAPPYVIYTYASDVEFDQDPKFSSNLKLVSLYWYVTCQLDIEYRKVYDKYVFVVKTKLCTVTVACFQFIK